jgi:hypothetical protein
MSDAKTVDNLGLDVHQNYIDKTRLLSDEEVQKIYQTPNIASRAEVLTTAPKYSEIDLLWGAAESQPSFFAEPPNFVLATDVFTYKTIPSVEIEEIKQKLDSLKKEKESDVEKKRAILTNFASRLNIIDKNLELIKRKQDEFHKG